MKKIALVAYVDEEEAVERLRLTSEVLSKSDVRLLVFEKYRNACSELPYNFEYYGEKELFANADVVVVLGGDGSFLTAAREAIPLELPLVCVNFGHIGYMSELEKGELHKLNRLATGDYDIVERMTMQVDILSDGVEKRVGDCCLNEAVISHGNVSKIADIALYCDSEHVADYRADGLIVATPTGSTAYSMSAGGPILDPYMKCMCVTPICPQELTARPMLFGSASTLEIFNICERLPSLYLTLDGCDNYEIERGMCVRIKQSRYTAKMINFGERRFFDILKSKIYRKNQDT